MRNGGSDLYSIEYYVSVEAEKLCNEKSHSQCEMNTNPLLQYIASTATTSSYVQLINRFVNVTRMTCFAIL